MPWNTFWVEMGRGSVQSVGSGMQTLHERLNGKLPEWERRFNRHDLPVVTTKREKGVYPDEVKGATGSARLSFPASGCPYRRVGVGLTDDSREWTEKALGPQDQSAYSAKTVDCYLYCHFKLLRMYSFIRCLSRLNSRAGYHSWSLCTPRLSLHKYSLNQRISLF